MDKIKKALQKLNIKEQKVVKDILKKVLNKEIMGLNIQKLSGHNDIYRVRKGSIRIFIVAIERRSEKTYRDF